MVLISNKEGIKFSVWVYELYYRFIFGWIFIFKKVWILLFYYDCLILFFFKN